MNIADVEVGQKVVLTEEFPDNWDLHMGEVFTVQAISNYRSPPYIPILFQLLESTQKNDFQEDWWYNGRYFIPSADPRDELPDYSL